MKTFIIFLALLIINLTFVVYQSDLGKYMGLQKNLKALSEDCAGGAALYFDEEGYANGNYVFNYKECEEFVAFMLEKNSFNSQYGITMMKHSIKYEDDLLGYKGEEIPSVTVALTLEVKDIFRVPFMTVKSIERESKYELPEI